MSIIYYMYVELENGFLSRQIHHAFSADKVTGNSYTWSMFFLVRSRTVLQPKRIYTRSCLRCCVAPPKKHVSVSLTRELTHTHDMIAGTHVTNTYTHTLNCTIVALIPLHTHLLSELYAIRMRYYWVFRSESYSHLYTRDYAIGSVCVLVANNVLSEIFVYYAPHAHSTRRQVRRRDYVIASNRSAGANERESVFHIKPTRSASATSLSIYRSS